MEVILVFWWYLEDHHEIIRYIAVVYAESDSHGKPGRFSYVKNTAIQQGRKEHDFQIGNCI